MPSATNPKEILSNLGIPARKSLSQNFLVASHWAEKLTQALLEGSPFSEIWEIGPGLGALTGLLMRKSMVPVRVFEYDRKIVGFLRESYPGLEIIEGDILEQDLNGLLRPEAKVGLISNLPYHISSPILFKLLEVRHRLGRLVLTFQREVAERLIASPNTQSYGALSILMQTSFQMESMGVIPKGAFYPQPEVQSQALLLTPKPFDAHPFELLRKLVKTAFLHRRKYVIRNFESEFSKTEVERAFDSLKLSPQARAEEISIETYHKLAELLEHNSI